MVNIIKEELSLEESLRKKIEFICDFTNNKPTINFLYQFFLLIILPTSHLLGNHLLLLFL